MEYEGLVLRKKPRRHPDLEPAAQAERADGE
jgi:hypothetical protein